MQSLRPRIKNAARASKWALGLVVGALALSPLMAQDLPNFGFFPDWPMFGQNAANTASAFTIGLPAWSVKSLKTKWTFTTGGDVSARAAVANGVTYFPDWGGNIWALNANTGTKIWGKQLSSYFTGAASGSIHSRTCPAVVDGVVYIGTQEGAYLLAINANTGALLWKTQLSVVPGTNTVDDPYAIISTSPVVVNGVVYTGVASIAEGGTEYGVDIATSTARGSVVAINTLTHAIQWKTYTVPVGYVGGGVWGSNPVVDIFRNTVFVGTGDNYRHPLNTAESVAPYANYGACIAKEPEASCLSPNDHFDSILALDMNTGQIKWSVKEASWNQQSSVEGIVNGSDDWNVDCLIEGFDPAAVQCPTNHGPDYDFGSAPNEITYLGPWGIPQTIIGAGQKSGIYYALDPDTGAQLWRTQVGPGSALGGIEWGSASDGQRIYVAISNYFGYPNAAGGNAGSWAALDPATGKILWQTPDPNGAIDLSPMAVANGVVYAASMAGTATAQNMLALDASTGKTLWTFEAGSSVIAGASVAGGTVYWGSGYTHLGLPGQIGGKNLFFAFSVNGQ